MKYILKTRSSTSLTINDTESIAAHVTWKDWNPSSAKIHLTNSLDQLQIKGTLLTRRKIYRNKKQIGWIEYSRGADVCIQLKTRDEEPFTITIVTENLRKQIFKGYLNRKTHLFSMNSDSIWFKTHFEITTLDISELDFSIEGLMGIIGYCTYHLLYDYFISWNSEPGSLGPDFL